MNIKEAGIFKAAKLPSIGKSQDIINKELSDVIKHFNDQTRQLQERITDLEEAKKETFKYIKGNLNKEKTVPNKDHEVQIKSSNSTIDAKVIDSVLDLMVKNTLPYAQIDAENYEVVILVKSDFYSINFISDGLYYKCTPDSSNNQIVIKIPGDYLIILSGTVDSVSGSAAARYRFYVSTSGGVPSAYINLNGGSGEHQQIVTMGIANLQAGDTLNPQVKNITNTENIKIIRMNLIAIKLR